MAHGSKIRIGGIYSRRFSGAGCAGEAGNQRRRTDRMGLCPALQCVTSNPSRCRDARRSPARRTMSAANNVDVKRTPHCVHTDLSSAKFHSIARTEINAAFPDPVCRSRFGLRHQENDHVDENDSGACVRVRRHPGRTGVCRPLDLRVQHVSIRQLRRHRRSLLPLSHAGARPAPHRRWPAKRRPPSCSVGPAVVLLAGTFPCERATDDCQFRAGVTIPKNNTEWMAMWCSSAAAFGADVRR